MYQAIVFLPLLGAILALYPKGNDFPWSAKETAERLQT